MARHPRTIWKPTRVIHTAIADSTAPVVAFFQTLLDVDADSSEGRVLRHVRTTLTFGLTNATSLDSSRMVTGTMGYFKWPSDAAGPTIATIDLENRGKIWGRKVWTVQGDTVARHTMVSKSVRLTLGETLFFYVEKVQESNSNDLINVAGITLWHQSNA